MPPRHAPHNHGARRRATRQARRDPDAWQLRVFEGPPLGPSIQMADPAEVLARIRELPPDLPWDVIGPDVIPLIPRIRPHPAGAPNAVERTLPPGIAVQFGIDIGPATLGIHAGMLHEWGISEADLVATALANLERRASSLGPRDVIGGSPDPLELRALQTQRSIASVLVLVPDVIERVFGPEPQLLVAPMRDLIASVRQPGDPTPLILLYDELRTEDPNILPGYVYEARNGRISLFGLLTDPASILSEAAREPVH